MTSGQSILAKVVYGVAVANLLGALVACTASDFAGNGSVAKRDQDASRGNDAAEAGDVDENSAGQDGADGDGSDVDSNGDGDGDSGSGGGSNGGDGDSDGDSDRDGDGDSEAGLDEEDDVQSKPCTSTPTYDPEDIQCHQPLTAANWTGTAAWASDVATYASSGGDAGARWISPLAGCANPGQDLLISVSHFKVTKKGKITIHALNDNTGKIRIWKNAKPSQEVRTFTTVDEAYNGFELTLEPGFYSIVADTSNRAAVSALNLSVVTSAGKTLRVTEEDGDKWCIFRVARDTNVEKFVVDNASCRKCFTGRTP